MGSFDSPIGKKSFKGPQLKELDIPDDSGYNTPSHQEPVVRRRQLPNINSDAIRDFQAQVQRQSMPTYDQDPAEVEREIRQARAERKSGRERLNDGAKKRLEMLLGMTRGTRSATIMEHQFVLQTIPSKEMREAIMIASEYDGTVQSPFEVRRQLLARSITTIAGVDAAQFVGSNDIEDKLAVIDELGESILNRLYTEYLLLVQESDDKFAIKTAADVGAVIDDLKK